MEEEQFAFSFDIWILYVGTVLVLMSTPGPSQLLILSNSLSSGFPRSAFTAAGDLSANLIQMIVAMTGLAALLEMNPQLLTVIKWTGVAYLLYSGFTSLFKDSGLSINTEANPRSRKALYFQGFIVSAVNPKAVIFFAALFPQFIDSSDAVVPQFIVLSSTYLLMDGAFLLGYATLAIKLADWLKRNESPLFHRMPGALLIAVALGLALKTV